MRLPGRTSRTASQLPLADACAALGSVRSNATKRTTDARAVFRAASRAQPGPDTQLDRQEVAPLGRKVAAVASGILTAVPCTPKSHPSPWPKSAKASIPKGASRASCRRTGSARGSRGPAVSGGEAPMGVRARATDPLGLPGSPSATAWPAPCRRREGRMGTTWAEKADPLRAESGSPRRRSSLSDEGRLNVDGGIHWRRLPRRIRPQLFGPVATAPCNWIASTNPAKRVPCRAIW